MAIITVVDDDYLSGKEFAKTVASKLGFQFVDGMILVDRAAAWGGDRERLSRACEQPLRFLEHFFGSKEFHILQLRAALAKDVEGGNVVCFGAAADLLNLRSSEILRVRVKSSFESRRRVTQDQTHLTSEEAKKYIERGERRRERWRAYLRESESTTPYGPGLLINLDQENADHACDTIRDMIECRARLQPTNQDAASTRKWVLCAAIRAAMAQCPETRSLDLDVAVEGDAVVLSLIAPASDGGSFPVRLAPSVGRAIRTALAKQPGTRNLHPEVTVQGDTVVLRGIVQGATESIGVEPVSANAEARSDLASSGVPDQERSLVSGRWWDERLRRWLPLLKRRDLPARNFSAAALAAALIVASLIYVGLTGRGKWHPPHTVQLQSFLGVITDSTCGLIQKGAPLSVKCIQSCVRTKGAKYVLKEDAHVMVISNPQVAEDFAARKVLVTGTFDPRNEELHIASIALAGK